MHSATDEAGHRIGDSTGGRRPAVSVIIPVYNDHRGLAKCLAALSAQTYPNELVEILVIDNGSDREPTDVLADFPRARLLREPRAGSYAARNAGILAVRTPVLAFIDADCEAAPQWLEAGVGRLRDADSQGVVGGRIELLVADPDAPSLCERYDAVTYLNQEKSIAEKGFGVTANLFVRREVFDRIGLFDATLKSGGDKEWGGRCRLAGIHPLYAPDVCVGHPARNTLGALIKKTRRVAGGVRSLRQRAPAPWNRNRLLVLGWLLLRPFAKSARLWRHPGLPTTRDRLGVIALSWLLTSVAAVETLRVRLRGEPRRS